MNRTATISATLGLAVLLLAGCAATTPAPTPSIATPTSSGAGGAIIGNVIEAEQITDSLGTYTHTTIDPEAEVFTTLTDDIDPTLYDRGWTDQQLLSAQQWVVTFIAEETSDSVALDRAEGWNEWLTTVYPNVADKTYVALTDDLIVVPHDEGPTFVRDGGPRVLANTIYITGAENVDYEGKSYVRFIGRASTGYRTLVENIITFGMESNNVSREEVLASNPDLAAYPDPRWGWSVEAEFNYVLEPHADSWWIVGYHYDAHGEVLLLE